MAAAKGRRSAGERKYEKSFRETLNPLKNLKTAKSGLFRAQNINDLAKHTISLAKRFRFVLGRKRKEPLRFSFRAKFWRAERCGRGGPQKFGKPLVSEKAFFSA